MQAIALMPYEDIMSYVFAWLDGKPELKNTLGSRVVVLTNDNKGYLATLRRGIDFRGTERFHVEQNKVLRSSESPSEYQKIFSHRCGRLIKKLVASGKIERTILPPSFGSDMIFE